MTICAPSADEDSEPPAADNPPEQPLPRAWVQPVHDLTRHRRGITIRVTEMVGGHALVFGTVSDNCLVRIHSRCFYGDVLGSNDCDCGPELDLALDMIQVEGSGVLLYLDQEGRGQGLTAKARGYAVSQATGLDTFQSYEYLGYEPDSRTYTDAAEMLRCVTADATVDRIRLLTNNPDKITSMTDAGYAVTQIPLRIDPTMRSVYRYLLAKQQRRQHALTHLSRTWVQQRLRNTAILAVIVTAGGLPWAAVYALTGFRVADEVLNVSRLLITAACLGTSRWLWDARHMWRARILVRKARIRVWWSARVPTRADHACVETAAERNTSRS